MQMFGRPSVPGASRGFLPLLVAALAGGVRTGVGVSQAISRSGKNKKYIEESYRRSSRRQALDQANARQSIAESANARGLAQGGLTASPIRTAMMSGIMQSTSNPSTIGEQTMSDAGEQMGLERQDLDEQHSRALKANKAAFTNALLGAAKSGISTGTSIYSGLSNYGAGKGAAALDSIASAENVDPGAVPTDYAMTPTSRMPDARSRIGAAMLSASSFGGIHPNDPNGEETSAWHTPKLADPDQTNGSFTG